MPSDDTIESESQPPRSVMVVFGTRPEAIKMAPLITALNQTADLRPFVVVTGQHRHMLDQVNGLFGITSDVDLDIIRPRQTLEQITTAVLSGLGPVLAAQRPSCLVVQGDTSTTFTAALAAFYQHVDVVHLEAGLRTGLRYDPFPEEINRRLTTQLASLHLAPTQTNRDNLERDGVAGDRIIVTGNTVIDALLSVLANTPASSALLPAGLAGRGRLVTITTHRRESWGEPMARTARALAILADRFPDVTFVLPLHLNPTVRNILIPVLSGKSNVALIEPLEYREFAILMNASELVLTDSGGVQEEAPSLGKPVLVMRDTTERREALAAGTVRLVGTDVECIVEETTTLLRDPQAHSAMARAINPYGDGQAAPRCVAAIRAHLNGTPLPIDFRPALSG